MEVLAGVDVAAVLPLHLLQGADREAVGLAKGGAGAQDVEELVLLAQGGKALAQLGVALGLGGDQDGVHLGDALDQGVIDVEALLGTDELGGKHQAEGSGLLGLRRGVLPDVHPAGPLAGVDARAGVVGHGDDGGTTGLGERGGIVVLGGVARVAAGDDEAVLAQLGGRHEAELAAGVEGRDDAGALGVDQVAGGNHVDHGAAAGHPVDLLDGALLVEDGIDEFLRGHVCLLCSFRRAGATCWQGVRRAGERVGPPAPDASRSPRRSSARGCGSCGSRPRQGRPYSGRR